LERRAEFERYLFEYGAVIEAALYFCGNFLRFQYLINKEVGNE
jgi:hypothetical protein